MATSRPSTSGLQKRNYLSLEKKVEVIKHLQKNPGTSVDLLEKYLDVEKPKLVISSRIKSLYYHFMRLIPLVVESIPINLDHQSMLKSMMHFIKGSNSPVPRMCILEGHD